MPDQTDADIRRLAEMAQVMASDPDFLTRIEVRELFYIAERQREALEGMREVIGLLTLSHEMWDRQITAPEDASVDSLCQYWGYGAVMDAASRLWAKADPDGSFVVGTCRMFARRALAALGQLKEAKRA